QTLVEQQRQLLRPVPEDQILAEVLAGDRLAVVDVGDNPARVIRGRTGRRGDLGRGAGGNSRSGRRLGGGGGEGKPAAAPGAGGNGRDTEKDKADPGGSPGG